MGVITANVVGSSSLNWGVDYPQLGDQGSHRRSPRPALYADWYRPVRDRIIELVRLPDNWDGRGARHVSEQDVLDALNFMASVMRFDTVAPWIGPLSSGGLQVTWRQGDVEVEAVFDSARHERVLVVAVGDHEWEETVERGGSLFATVIDRLTAEPPVPA